MKKMKILICRILNVVHYRVYKCIAILHTPMGRTHGENSMSKLDNDAKRVANIYMELPHGVKTSTMETININIITSYNCTSYLYENTC